MDWLEITVNTTTEDIEALASRLEDLGVEGLVINDEPPSERS
jgi:ribosomal protein L11 methylase PrmA